ncbi:MAG TPA: DUF3147 family protein [Candidatus Dormibacteraeota bacterium]
MTLREAVAAELRRERDQLMGIDREKLVKPNWPQLGLRFLFGGGIALVAGLVGMRFGLRVGGLFLAFPAVLPAALTLTESDEGASKTTVDAIGAILGSVAMVAFAAAVAGLVISQGAPLAVAVGAAAWALVAGALFQGLRELLRRLL